MARHFTLAEAAELLPAVDHGMREALRLREEYQASEDRISEHAQRVNTAGGMVVNRGHMLDMRAARERAAEALKQTIESVQGLGCEIKDLDIGLIDFRSYYRDQEVYLCWRVGEPSIEYWHGIEEGFRGRKKIDTEFLENHRGDRRQ